MAVHFAEGLKDVEVNRSRQGRGALSSQNFTLDSKQCTFTQLYDMFKDKMGQNAL